MDRWIHLDLKGAPPLHSSSFWPRWCSYIKEKGRVSGLIVELEDVLALPMLAEADANQSRRHVYSSDQIQHLLQVAIQHGLAIIPLIQTFGHLEYLLKYPRFAHLQEVQNYPDSIQPAENQSSESLHVIAELLDQSMSLLNDLKISCPAIHLGGDEVWHMGQGERSKERLDSQNETKIDLFLKHMTLVVEYVRKKYPEKRILVWDDMLRTEKEFTMKKDNYRVLREHAELVVWQYTSEPGRYMPNDLFSKYAGVFSKPPWIATAFKGATSSCAFIPDLGHHVGNHLAWMRAIESGVPFGKIEPAGIIMTGWQRFDHYASLCELLPVAVPSLRCCFVVLDKGKFTDEELQYCFADLGLQNPQVEGNEPKFPGSELYVAMTKFVGLRNAYLDFIRHDTLTTWVNDWQIANKCVSRLQSEAIVNSLKKIQCDLNALKPTLEKSLELHFEASTKDEWIGTYLAPIESKISDMVKTISPAVDT